MAHPYTTSARLRRLVAGKSERLLALLDRDGDGVADTDGTTPVLDDVIERACNRIDGALGMAYSVPFSTTSGPVADMADKLAAAELFFWIDPESADGKRYLDEVEGDLEMYRTRKWAIPNATPIDPDTGRTGVRYESIGTVTAGGSTNGSTTATYTSETVDQTRGI